MSTCKFDIAWVGTCKKPSDESGICEHHKTIKCDFCGEQATRETDHTFGAFTCPKMVCSSEVCWNKAHS